MLVVYIKYKCFEFQNPQRSLKKDQSMDVVLLPFQEILVQVTTSGEIEGVSCSVHWFFAQGF